MQDERYLPIGIQDFEKLRTDGYVYVDKTAYAYNLAKLSLPYFLGRPRRFGKSLLLSTFKAYFLGKKELFEGLAISGLEKDWIEYPVIYIDFNKAIYNNVHILHEVLDATLSEYEEMWSITVKQEELSLRFYKLIQCASRQSGRKVVVLVDEYDKPLLGVMNNTDANEPIRNALKSFYSVLKSADAYLRFVFLTGVTKFSKVSIFSDLNQLQDISMNNRFSGICGISETELTAYFEPEIIALAEGTGKSYEETLAELKKRYDGYRFCKEGEDMYNPFSLLNTFVQRDYNDYWFQTGTPTFLVDMIKKGDFEIPNLDSNIQIPAKSIMDYRAERNNPIPILYQSGYLTIKSYNADFNEYTLGFPNEEVKYGFLNELLPAFAPHWEMDNDFSAARFVKALQAGDTEHFMANMRAFYASIPYDMAGGKNERYYQFVFYLLFSLMGQFVQTEVKSARGRADAVVKTADTVYVFEFKMSGNGTAEDALEQIDGKGYPIPYTADGRKIVKIGAEFSEEERGLSRWIIV